MRCGVSVKLRILCVCLCVMALMCSCSKNKAPASPGCTPYPIPEKLSIGGSVSVPFYFAPENSARMEVEQRSVLFYNDMFFQKAVVNELLHAVMSDGDTRFPISNCSLDNIEYSGDVCCIELSCKDTPNAEAIVKAQCVLCATLHDTFSVNHVQLFINGASASLNGLPLGAADPLTTSDSLETYVSDLLQPFNDTDENATIQSNLVYYLPNANTGLLHAYVQKTAVSRESTATEIINMLIDKLKARAGENFPINNCTFDVSTYMAHAAQVVSIRASVVDNSVIENSLLLGKCLALTILSNLVGYESVDFAVKGETNVIINRANASESLGTDVRVYYPYLLSNVLMERTISVQYKESERLEYCIGQMLSNSNSLSIIYPVFSQEHCLSVYVDNGMAIVNCSEDFWNTLRRFITQEWSPVENSSSERLVIYGIVNTLTDMPYINSVLFLNDGESIEMLDNIYLGLPLYRNMGLVFDN